MMEVYYMVIYGFFEGDDYLSIYVCFYVLNEYILLIEQIKKFCIIFVIVSINCFSNLEWIDFVCIVEVVEVDVLEINIFFLQIEKEY